MTQAARKVGGGAHSPLALLLCVVILAVAVASEGAPNDAIRDWTLTWADADVDDDAQVSNSLMADDHAALCERLSIVLFENHSPTDTSRLGRQSELIPAGVQPRGPPPSREVVEATRHRRLIILGARYPRFSTACSGPSLFASRSLTEGRIGMNELSFQDEAAAWEKVRAYINQTALKIAKALGLSILPSLRLRADQVIASFVVL